VVVFVIVDRTLRVMGMDPLDDEVGEEGHPEILGGPRMPRRGLRGCGLWSIHRVRLLGACDLS
jgi:hypothetical protein